uniref:Zinc transporter 7-A n=1 Tax=Caligus clemensi TaxID=344056 RepID=C1C183_CALCM|nr:Zinc transporter 7-A [Caligus clemensi]
MLPLYKDEKSSASFPQRIAQKVKNVIRLILSDPNSKNLLGFLVLNFSFAFVELFYGIWTNSLGLISDAFHMFFDCTGLLAGLAASVISKWKANERFFLRICPSRGPGRLHQRTFPSFHFLFHIERGCGEACGASRGQA